MERCGVGRPSYRARWTQTLRSPVGAFLKPGNRPADGIDADLTSAPEGMSHVYCGVGYVFLSSEKETVLLFVLEVGTLGGRQVVLMISNEAMGSSCVRHLVHNV